MNTIVEHINSAGFSFVEFAVPMFVQSGILIVILLLADLLLRKKVKAVFRYWIWMLVLLKLVLPTSLSSPLSLGYLFGEKLTYQDLAETTSAFELADPVPTDNPSGISPIYIQPNVYTPPTMPTPSIVEPAIAEPTSPPAPVTPLSWQGVVFLVWLAVVIAMGLLLLQRALFVRGLVAQAKDASRLMNDALEYCRESMKIRRKVGLKISPNATTPSVCGLIRPVVLVPWNLASTLGASRLRTVLIHELAHIRRADLWVNLAQTILQIVYFYNPLLWIANCMIRRIREQAVDEAVLVAMGEKAQKYPQTLVDVAKMAFKRPALSLRLIGVVESESALAGRINHILGRPMPKTARLSIMSVLSILIAASVLLPMARAGRGVVLTVAADGSAEYSSIQKAVDAASAGAVVRIAPGVYKEQIKIEKPLTLEGAGWDKTTITAENNTADVFEEVMDKMREEFARVAMKRMQDAKTEKERSAIETEFETEFEAKFKDKFDMQAVLVSDTEGVVIRGLKVSYPGRHIEGRVISVPIVRVSSAEAKMSGCVLTGCPGDGIHVMDGSDLEIRNCLVGGLWSTGVVVGRDGSAGSRLRILDSDVRNCYYAGIWIRAGNEPAEIKRCRVSGAAWHGIIYSGNSPTIEDNAVFGNARIGIGASHGAAGTVRRNIIYGNEIGGMSCSYGSRPVIKGNTFANNKESGLRIFNTAKPIVRKNVFAGNPTAVFCGNFGGDEPSVWFDGVVTLENNLFWDHEHKAVWQHLATEEQELKVEDISLGKETGNIEFDPLFVNLQGKDFSLSANSPALVSEIGVSEPLAFDSPWPLQEEELAIIPDGDTRDWRHWKQKGESTPMVKTEKDADEQAGPLDHFVGKYALAGHPDTAVFEIKKEGDVFIFRDLGGPKFEMDIVLRGLEGRSFEMEKGRDSLTFGNNPRERYRVRYNATEDRYVLDSLGMRGEVQDSMISPLTDLVKISAEKPDGTFAATLPNGVTVELVGVCEFLKDGRNCWKPDGSKLDKAIYLSKGGVNKTSENLFGLIVRTDKLCDLEWVQIDDMVDRSNYVAVVDENGQPIRDGMYYYGIKVWFANRGKTNIRMRVTPSKWNLKAIYDGKYIIGKLDPKVRFFESYETANGVSVIFDHDYDNYDCRMVAKVSPESEGPWQYYNGKRLCFSTLKTVFSPDRSKKTTAVFEGLKLSDVEHFEFGIRHPYKSVQFKNVSLLPGVKPDVQVKVEGSEPVFVEEIETAKVRPDEWPGIESSILPKLVMLLDAINSCATETDLNIDSISISERNIEIKGDTSDRANTRKFLDAVKDNGLNVSSLRLNAADNRDKFITIVEPKQDWQQWWQQRKTDVQLGAEETVTPKLIMLLVAIKSIAAEMDLNIESISVSAKSMSIEGDTSGRTDTLKFLDAIKDNGLDISQLNLDKRNNRDRFRMDVEPKKDWWQWWQKHKSAVPVESEPVDTDNPRDAVSAIVEQLKSVKYVNSGRGSADVVEVHTNSSYQSSTRTEKILDFRFEGGLSRSDAFTSEKGKRGDFECSWAVGPMSSVRYNKVYGSASVQARPFGQFYRKLGYDFHPETFPRMDQSSVVELLEAMVKQPQVTLKVTPEPKDVVRIVSEHKNETSEEKCIMLLINGADGMRMSSWEYTARDSTEDGTGARRSSLRLKWKKYAGLWYISEAISEGAGVHDGLRTEGRTTVTIREFTPNVDIEDKEFTLEGLDIPPGAMVNDRVLDTRYRYAGSKGDAADMLRKLSRAAQMYANDYDNKFPNSMQQLKRFLDEEELKWLSENVCYLGKGKTVLDLPDIPLAYDRTMLEAKQSIGTNVLFVSGIVSFRTREQLKKLGITAGLKTDVKTEVEQSDKTAEATRAEPTLMEAGKTRGGFSGVVVNSVTGKPIAGAYVGVGDFGDSGGSNYSRHREQGFYDKTKTDAEGRFELNGLVFTDKNHEIEYHPLVVTHPDFVRHDERIELLSGVPAPDVKVSLRPAAKIDITIVDADGNPIQGQWLLRLEDLDGRRFIPPGSDPHLSSFASNVWAHWPDLRANMGFSNGFTFTELDSGRYLIEALKFQLVDKPTPGNVWKPTITYHGSIPSLEIEAGQSKQVRLTPQDNQTQLTITAPEFPDKLMDKLERSSQMPLMCLISRSPGAMLWDDGRIRHLEDQRFGRIDKKRFFRGFFSQGQPLTINNLPPASYSLFTMAVYGQVAGYLIGTRADLAKGDNITLDIPWRQPTGPSMFGPNRSFDYPVKLEARDYSLSELCEILTEITQSNPRIAADPSIENEQISFGKGDVSIWDLLEKLYLENGWRVNEGQEKTLIIKPAEQTDMPIEVEGTAEAEIERLREAETRRAIAEGRKGRIEFLGLDLTDAPRATKSADLSDLFEERPPASKSYHRREDIDIVYSGLDGNVYYIPDKEIFYIQHDKLGASTLTYYGPFSGDPHLVLDMEIDMPIKAGEAEASSGESEVTANESGPRIAFESLVCDLGQIPPNTKHVCELKFTNNGNEVLKITKVLSPCGCITSELKKKEYAPGESETLKVTYRASGHAGRITKRVDVYSNDNVNPKIALTIKAEIVIKVAHEPKILNILLKGENAGCPPITLTSLDNQPFSITGLKSSGDSITADFDPSVKDTSFVLKPKVDMEKLGKGLNGRIEISLNHPECKTLMIIYKILPEFEFNPRVVYVREAEPLKPVTKKVWIRSNYDEDVEVESTSSKKGTVKVLTQQKARNGHQFELQITPPVQESNKRVFTDVFTVRLKSGQQLRITCYGIYSKKPAKTAVESAPKADSPVEAEDSSKPAIQIESRLLMVSEELLADVGLKTNSVYNADSKFKPDVVESTDSPISQTHSFILDDIIVSFLVRAVQADETSTVIAAPKVTVVNGKDADFSVHTQVDYISDYTEPNRPSGEPEPKHDFVEIGTWWKVNPKITPDNKHILLDVDFEMCNLLGFEERTYKQKYAYKIPQTEASSIKTRLLVPDGQTVLMAGKKVVAEENGRKVQKELLVLIKAQKADVPSSESRPPVEGDGTGASLVI